MSISVGQVRAAKEVADGVVKFCYHTDTRPLKDGIAIPTMVKLAEKVVDILLKENDQTPETKMNRLILIREVTDHLLINHAAPHLIQGIAKRKLQQEYDRDAHDQAVEDKLDAMVEGLMS